jgi:hypothetical protein
MRALALVVLRVGEHAGEGGLDLAPALGRVGRLRREIDDAQDRAALLRRQDALVGGDAVRGADRGGRGLGAPEIHRAIARAPGDGTHRLRRRIVGDARSSPRIVLGDDAADGWQRFAHRCSCNA